MFNIDKFLSKFSKQIAGSEIEKNFVLEEIYNKTGIQLTIQDIEIKNFTAFITASPAVKNKLFMYKEGILKEINQKPGLKIVNIK